MRRLLLVWLVLIPSLAQGFDATDYRTATYGAPDHYCDLTLSIGAPSGTGTLGDPWNATRCMSEPVAGDVIGILPGVSVAIPSRKGTGDEAVAAFQPANSGTVGNPIVYVTKYAAVALSSIETNGNRTEFRHNGTADAADVVGTGGAMLGANTLNYITYDGFYVNMAYANITEDSGVLSPRASTGVKFLNWVIKGTTTDVDSNAVIVRSNADTDTVYSNFWLYGYNNAPTGAGLNQEGIFSDLYGSQNYTMSYFLIEDTDRGIFPKGTAAAGSIYNYGTIEYGIIRRVDTCFRFNDFDATNVTTLHHVLCSDYASIGVGLTAETSAPRNFLAHHLTVANGCTSGGNCKGPLWARGSSATSVTIRDNIFDYVSAVAGEGFNGGDATYGTFPTVNYNGYYNGGTAGEWSFNGSAYTTIANWRTATSQEANSQLLGSDPFTNRAGGVFTIAGGHAALTASSTGGELGAYEGSIDPGVNTAASGSTTSTGRTNFAGRVIIQ